MGDLQKNPTEAKTAHLMQNKAIFFYFKHEIQLFKVLLSLKVVKFDTKMGKSILQVPDTGTSQNW